MHWLAQNDDEEGNLNVKLAMVDGDDDYCYCQLVSILEWQVGRIEHYCHHEQQIVLLKYLGIR